MSTSNKVPKVMYSITKWIERKLGLKVNATKITSPSKIKKIRLQKIDEHLKTMIRVIIWKQWKTAKKREWRLFKVGVENWIAHKIANWGNHYQLVITNLISFTDKKPKNIIFNRISKLLFADKRFSKLSVEAKLGTNAISKLYYF